MTTFTVLLLLFIISNISIGDCVSCPTTGWVSCEDRSKCTREWEICDGHPNCPKATDERNCENYTCLRRYTKCLNNIQCVPDNCFCNRNPDCKDSSDESWENAHCAYHCRDQNPCVHGKCITTDRRGKFGSCNCTGTGYNDLNCSTDNCVTSNPCINGVCINNGDGTLRCDYSGTGYTGALWNTKTLFPETLFPAPAVTKDPRKDATAVTKAPRKDATAVTKAPRKDVSPQTASEQTELPSVNTQHEPTATGTARQSELTDTSAAPGATHNLPPGKTERVESKPDTGKSSVSLETVILVAVGVAAVFVSFLGVALMAGNIFTSVTSAGNTAAMEANKANTASEDKNAREKITNPLGDSRESKSSETSLAITEPGQSAQTNDTTEVDLSADQSKHK